MRNRLLKIGKRIAFLRKTRNITQIELSKIADVDYSTLRKVETGKTKNPSAVFCAKIANGLGVGIENIICIDLPHTTIVGSNPYYSKRDEVLLEFKDIGHLF